jgi:hypothetical protein
MARNKPKTMKCGLPANVKRWVESEAKRNASSQASEIVRAIRERMERLEKPARQPEAA